MAPTGQTPQFRATEVISGASQHANNVTFAGEFSRGTVWALRTLTPRRQQTFPTTLNCHSPMTGLNLTHQMAAAASHIAHGAYL